MFLFPTRGLFVDVYNCRARLAYTDGFETRYLAAESYTDELEEELLNVLDDAGGAINISGQYFIAEPERYPAIVAAVRDGRWR